MNTTVQIQPHLVVVVERIGPDRFIVKCQKQEQVVQELKVGETLTVSIPIEVRK